MDSVTFQGRVLPHTYDATQVLLLFYLSIIHMLRLSLTSSHVWLRILDSVTFQGKRKGTQRARAENCPISTTFPLFSYIKVYLFSINRHFNIVKILNSMPFVRSLRKIHHDPDRHQMNVDDVR